MSLLIVLKIFFLCSASNSLFSYHTKYKVKLSFAIFLYSAALFQINENLFGLFRVTVVLAGKFGSVE